MTHEWFKDYEELKSYLGEDRPHMMFPHAYGASIDRSYPWSKQDTLRLTEATRMVTSQIGASWQMSTDADSPRTTMQVRGCEPLGVVQMYRASQHYALAEGFGTEPMSALYRNIHKNLATYWGIIPGNNDLGPSEVRERSRAHEVSTLRNQAGQYEWDYAMRDAVLAARPAHQKTTVAESHPYLGGVFEAGWWDTAASDQIVETRTVAARDKDISKLPYLMIEAELAHRYDLDDTRNETDIRDAIHYHQHGNREDIKRSIDSLLHGPSTYPTGIEPYPGMGCQVQEVYTPGVSEQQAAQMSVASGGRSPVTINQASTRSARR